MNVVARLRVAVFVILAAHVSNVASAQDNRELTDEATSAAPGGTPEDTTSEQIPEVVIRRVLAGPVTGLAGPSVRDISRYQWYLDHRTLRADTGCVTCLGMRNLWLQFGTGAPRTSILVVDASITNQNTEGICDKCRFHPDFPQKIPLETSEFSKEEMDALLTSLDYEREDADDAVSGDPNTSIPLSHDLAMAGLLAAKHKYGGEERGTKGLIPDSDIRLLNFPSFVPQEVEKQILEMLSTDARISESDISGSNFDGSVDDNLPADVRSARAEIRRATVSSLRLRQTSERNQQLYQKFETYKTKISETITGKNIDNKTPGKFIVAIPVQGDFVWKKRGKGRQESSEGQFESLNFVARRAEDSNFRIASSRAAFGRLKSGDLSGTAAERPALYTIAAGNDSRYVRFKTDAEVRALRDRKKDLNILVVGAVNKKGEIANYSNLASVTLEDGSPPEVEDPYVDIYAPAGSALRDVSCNAGFQEALSTYLQIADDHIGAPEEETQSAIVGSILQEARGAALQPAGLDEIVRVFKNGEYFPVTSMGSGTNCDVRAHGYRVTAGRTSAASTLVAGVAGIVQTINPELSAAETRDILLETARSFSSSSKKKIKRHMAGHRKPKHGDYVDVDYPRFKVVNPQRAVAKAVDKIALQWRDLWEGAFNDKGNDAPTKFASHFGYYRSPEFRLIQRTAANGRISCYVSRNAVQAERDEECDTVRSLDDYIARIAELKNFYGEVEIDIFPVGVDITDNEVSDDSKHQISDDSEEHNVDVVSDKFDGERMSIQFVQRFKGRDSNDNPIYCDVTLKKLDLVLKERLLAQSALVGERASTDPAKTYWWYVEKETTEHSDVDNVPCY